MGMVLVSARRSHSSELRKLPDPAHLVPRILSNNPVSATKHPLVVAHLGISVGLNVRIVAVNKKNFKMWHSVMSSNQ